MKNWFQIITIVSLLLACNKDSLRIKGRDNPLDSNFRAPHVEIRTSGDLTCVEMNSSIEVQWAKTNIDASLISPEAWVIRNGKKLQQITDEDFLGDRGNIRVNIASFGFDHLDNFQLFIIQSVSGRTWVDSIPNGPIVIYNKMEAPVFSAIQLKNSTAKSLSLTFDVFELGQTPVSEIGICYGLNVNPSISDLKISFPTPYFNKQILSTEIKDLIANKEYHFRVYSKKTSSVTYSRNRSFFTALPNKPTVSDPSSGSITSNSITVSSTIQDDGGGEIRETGFLYNTTGAPGLQDIKVLSALNGLSFTSTFMNLQPSTKYYVAAYAKNDGGTSIGNPVSITTAEKPCLISQGTTGTDYTIQIPQKSSFKPGETISISMTSPVYAFKQASSVILYDGDSPVNNYGTWLVFNNNSREFILPSTLKYSSCYNFRIVYYSDIYVTSRFTVNP